MVKNQRRTRRNKTLTEEQRQFLNKNWVVLKDKALASYLGTTEGAVRKLRHQMGLNRRELKDHVQDIPLVVWMPRNSYEDYEKDRKSLGIYDI